MWLMNTNSAQRIEEMQRQNMDKLNYEISEYYRMKRSREERRKKLEKIEKEIRSEKADTVPVGKPLRSQFKLVTDGILTSKELLPNDGQDKRTKGLVEVLIKMNEEDYLILKELFADGKIVVEIPSKYLAGNFRRVVRYTHSIIYLSPELENRSYNYVRKIAAHELAHLLHHNSFSTAKCKSIQETEADLQVLAWGF